jgi:DNA invertase Pin-like site-specific DNA recombinase
MRDRPDLPKKPFVYFARGNPSGLIKIGCSVGPDGRATALKWEVGEPLRVLFTLPGSFDKEQAYHRRFSACRSHGEWFFEADPLHSFLKARGAHGIKVILEKQVVHTPGPTKIVEVLKPYFVEKSAQSAGPRPTLIAYARVSTEEQNLSVQLTALRDAGVAEENIFVEKLSALSSNRPLFRIALKSLERGDTLVVHSLSRLGRDVKQIHEILSDLDREGIAWRSITEPHLNNATAVGRLMLNVTGAMAQFERDQIKERTQRGMDELRRQGKKLGRKPLVSDKDVKDMRTMRKKKVPVEKIAEKYGVKVSTVYARTNKKAA